METTWKVNDETTRRLLGRLYRQSDEIMRINASILTLQKDPAFYANENFCQFVWSFDEGRYYHFQCQGYMEGIVVTKDQSPQFLRYWFNRLFAPARDHLHRALAYFDRMQAKLESDGNVDSAMLNRQIQALRQTLESVQREVGHFNMP